MPLVVVKLACVEYEEQFALTCQLYVVPPARPVITTEGIVALTLVQVLAAAVLYCTVYPVAPGTAVQLTVAPVCVILALANPVGAAHPVDPVVVKLAFVEKAEQSALTLHT